MVRLSVGSKRATLCRFRGFLLWGLALVLLVAAAALSPRVLPFDMDEFAAYQPLGCLAHPLTREANTFREACGEYDLTPPLLSHALPLRSYRYIGSLPAVPFAPFWWLIRSPVAEPYPGGLVPCGGCLSHRETDAGPAEQRRDGVLLLSLSSSRSSSTRAESGYR